MNKPDTFYLVWNPLGRAPIHQHEKYHQAKTEAERLATLNPGQQFFVLQAVSLTKKVDVETIALIEPDHIPF